MIKITAHLEFGVELRKVSGFDVKNIAEVAEMSEYGLEGVGRAELVEDVCSQCGIRRHHRLAMVVHLYQLLLKHANTNYER